MVGYLLLSVQYGLTQSVRTMRLNIELPQS